MKIWERVIRTVYFGEKATSESYIRYLRKKGVQIGKGTTFYAPHQCYVDVQYPWLVTIGKDVSITAGTRILSHDYSWSVLERVYGVKLGQAPPLYVLREFTGLYAKNTQGQREDTALYRSYQSLLDDILAKEDR